MSQTLSRLVREAADAVPITCVTRESWPRIEAALPAPQAAYARATDFSPKAGCLALLPDAEGRVAAVLFGLGDDADPLLAGKLPGLLPPGTYRFSPTQNSVVQGSVVQGSVVQGSVVQGSVVQNSDVQNSDVQNSDVQGSELRGFDVQGATLAWLLGSYRFGRYRAAGAERPALAVSEGVDAEAVTRIAEAVARGRDLVNTPANDLGPAEIEAAIRAVADRHGAAVTVVTGEDLARDFPLVHVVGASSPRAPRLIDLTWGPVDAPRVTLVGKGVAFDTGGLDIKPSSAMLLMKKDMGGSAAALAAAEMVMGSGLNLRLRLIVPAVENAVSGTAFRPGDVIRSRAGLTVEIGNTDAEGRLILADALALADAEKPDLLIDFATLTGAARTALGPDLPAFFTEDEALAQSVAEAGAAVADPVWRLPLHKPYASLLDSKIADLNNVSGGPFAGAITAALFLRRFAPATRAHVHFDLYGWNPSTKPGRPEGGEVQTARLVHALLARRYPRA